MGDRKSYEITGGIQNFGGTGSLPSQSYNLAFYSRPITGWEFGGTAQFSRAPEQALTNQYYLGLTVLNFSSGEVNLSERRMQQYYYFSNLLPDPGQTVVSFTPTYSFYSESNYVNTSTIEAPLSFSYGLPDGFTLVADANFNRKKNSYPMTTMYATQTLEYGDTEFTAGAGLNRRFGSSTLVRFNADYYSLDSQIPVYSNEGFYGYESDQKQTFAVLTVGLDNLFLNTPVSVYDVRRSYYLGHYLHEGEASNSLTVRYATQDIRLTETMIQPLVPFGYARFGTDDKFKFGVLDMLELSAEGALLQHSGRYGNIGLTLHNLNFSGQELSDFDYFFGMINRPGDYTLSVDVSSSNVNFTPSTEISTTARYGIIRDLDVSANYSYQKINSPSEQSGNNWGFDVRGNLIGFMRLDGSANWGTTDYNSIQYNPSRMKSLNFNLSVKTFF